MSSPDSLGSEPCRRSIPDRHRERGAALIEFALVALALYILVAGVISLGQASFSQQIAQDAARLGARELALRPFPVNADFDQALIDPTNGIFDPTALVVDLDTLAADESIDDRFATLPLLNRALRPIYIFDRTMVEGEERNLLRFPGALVRTSTGALSVLVPRVVDRDNTGVETIEWLRVVEEVRPDADDPSTGTFDATANTPEAGLVALRINVPYQSASLSAFRVSDPDPFDPNLSQPILADDSAVAADALPDAAELVDSVSRFPVYDGVYGLGRLQVLGREVRPFRKLFVAQAFFRREVFE